MAKTVLLVDDSRLTLDMIGFAIRSEGYRALSAQGGLEALECLAANTVDLVLADINMPGMDGYTLIRKIRADSHFGNVPVIIVTTEAEAGDRRQGFEAGADAYLIKPVQPQELLSQIELLLGRA